MTRSFQQRRPVRDDVELQRARLLDGELDQEALAVRGSPRTRRTPRSAASRGARRAPRAGSPRDGRPPRAPRRPSGGRSAWRRRAPGRRLATGAGRRRPPRRARGRRPAGTARRTPRSARIRPTCRRASARRATAAARRSGRPPSEGLTRVASAERERPGALHVLGCASVQPEKEERSPVRGPGLRDVLVRRVHEHCLALARPQALPPQAAACVPIRAERERAPVGRPDGVALVAGCRRHAARHAASDVHHPQVGLALHAVRHLEGEVPLVGRERELAVGARARRPCRAVRPSGRARPAALAAARSAPEKEAIVPPGETPNHPSAANAHPRTPRRTRSRPLPRSAPPASHRTAARTGCRRARRGGAPPRRRSAASPVPPAAARRAHRARRRRAPSAPACRHDDEEEPAAVGQELRHVVAVLAARGVEGREGLRLAPARRDRVDPAAPPPVEKRMVPSRFQSAPT